MGKDIGREFMDRTCYEHLGAADQMKGVPAPPLELPCEKAKKRVALPEPDAESLRPVTIAEAIERRESRRSFAGTPLTPGELSFLLRCTQGVKEIVGGAATFRTVPSAGARHALETYLLINHVEGLDPGLYRYLALDHRLALLNDDDGIADAVTDGCLGQEMVKRCAAAFLWTAVPYRMTWRYGERGYRYLHLDAGHVCQNLYLAAEAVGCGVCAVAAFDDYGLNTTLGLDGVDQFVIYCAVVGKVE